MSLNVGSWSDDNTTNNDDKDNDGATGGVASGGGKATAAGGATPRPEVAGAAWHGFAAGEKEELLTARWPAPAATAATVVGRRRRGDELVVKGSGGVCKRPGVARLQARARHSAGSAALREAM